MLYVEVMTVYCENPTEQINTLCRQKAVFFSATESDSYHWRMRWAGHVACTSEMRSA